MKKNIVMICITVLLMLLLTSCKNSEETEAADFSRYTKSKRNNAYTEEGLFCFTDGLIHFISAETGMDTIFCFDPLCLHLPASASNQEPECMAAGYNNGTYMAYHEENIYFFVRESFEHQVYKMDINSGARTLVAELPFSCSITDVVFNGDYVYYTAAMNTLKNDSINGMFGMIEGYNELIELNLKSGEYRVLTTCGEENGGGFADCDVCGGNMFYVLYESEGRAVYSMSLDTLEPKLEVSPEDFVDKKYYCGIYNSENFFYFSKEGDIGIQNIVTDECKVVHKVELGEEIYLSTVDAGNGKVYYRTCHGSTEEYEYYLYDMEEKKLWNLTDKCRENRLNLTAYFPYEAMFEYIVYDESGNGIKGFAPVSEAWLLEE
ncbi:MAG: hypothetical protein J6B39_08340 [Lachnospiraceae bacterium]|nr:hypothetical protein [Lachnospiraceae bacterium]